GVRRLRNPPAVPTMMPLAYPALTATPCFGSSGPAGLPPEIVAQLNAEIVAALATPALRARLAGEGIETEKMSPDEFTRFVASEIAKWTPIAKSVAEQGSAR